MRRSFACAIGLALVLLACKKRELARPAPRSAAPSALASALLESKPPVAKPPNSAVLAVERTLQEAKLRPPLRRKHQPRLAFAPGVVARLTSDALEVWDEGTASLVASLPLEEPRLLVTLADGALLALGRAGLLRWERGHKAPLRPRPMLLPGSELFADAQQPNLIWIADTDGAPPNLASYRIDTEQTTPILLPEQTIELGAAPGGTFGVTREGVFVYVTPSGARRFAPSGAKLAPLATQGTTPPAWLLPNRRLDQSWWLDEQGALERVLVSPSFKVLERATLVPVPQAAAIGDEGRLLAVVAVTGAGPRFELRLFDSELKRAGTLVLPTDTPSGRENWAERVTRNQEVLVDPRRPRVAVGGPDRLQVVDEKANVIFSIPSNQLPVAGGPATNLAEPASSGQ